MIDPVQLETCTRELCSALRSLATQLANVQLPLACPGDGQTRVIYADPSHEAYRARESALANLNKLQLMLFSPGDFLEQLALQTQLLACIQWLGEFQVPACIPLDGSALMKDVSDLIGVPETKLARIIRMANLGGFLQEPTPGHIAHSPLSAAFVAKPSYLDAAMFLAGTVAPAAWEMAILTKQARESPHEAPRDVILHKGFFTKADKTQLPRLQRQWQAYLRHGLGHHCDTATDILTCLEPLRTSAALVVEVGARSTERVIALANKYPSFRLIAQLSPAASPAPTPKLQHPRIQLQQRLPGTPQPVGDAAVYIINFPLPEPGATWTSLMAEIDSELRAHLTALQKRPEATVVLTAPALPERGTAHADPDLGSRLRDLSLMQLANEREHEMSEVVNLLNGMGDGEGRLVLVNKVRSGGRHGAVALEIKYQAYPER
ncbi:hypothetical protein CNMCM7691_002782 [Aspergillus felis]|uniref:O-methyltransferase n=1 Tax=Aspergillus felis TaxID=1287682 RepID=A0A8H6QPP5_9EURO|nr:hypothetical protein CNMCM7691_002782 [Aspergillus felis]